MAKAPELQTPSEAGKKGGRGKRGSDSPPLSKGSTHKDRLAARLKRDHPEIAARVAQGEFKSIRVHEPPGAPIAPRPAQVIPTHGHGPVGALWGFLGGQFHEWLSSTRDGVRSADTDEARVPEPEITHEKALEPSETSAATGEKSDEMEEHIYFMKVM